MNRNVWIINFFAGTLESGWGERHYYLSKYFKANNIQPVIFSSSYNHMFRKLPHAPNQFNHQIVDGISYLWVKTPYYKPESILRFWSMIVFTYKILFVPIRKLKIEKPDVLIVSSMPIFPVLSGWWLKKRFKSKQFIFEVRDIWPLTAVMLGGYSKLNPMILLMGWLERFGYRKADKIVSVLPNAYQHINEISCAPEKLFVIPNGIELESTDSKDTCDEIVFDFPKNKFVVGYAGTLGLANAMDVVIEAAHLLKGMPEIHFVLVGDGYHKPALMQKAGGLDNVSFHPRIPKNCINKVISKFDVCVISWMDSPLYEHGVSANKYFDYMLAEKPILVAGNCAKDPVSESGCGLIVRPKSAEAIKEAIIKLYSMPCIELQEMGKLGKSYVLMHHNYENLAKKYISLFS